MAKIRQKLAKVYIHSQDNGVGNKVISCEIYDAGGEKDND